MTPAERKAAFRQQADLDRKTLGAVALEVVGVNWIHLSEGIKGNRPLSAEVKAKFSAYIGRSVSDVFATADAETVEGTAQSVENATDDAGNVLGHEAA